MPQQTKTQTLRERFDLILIDQLGLDEAPRDDWKFEDYEADSLDIVEIAMAIEEEFDISIDDGELELAVTVGRLFRVVQKVVGE